MNRRSFLQTAGGACAGLAFSRSLPAFADEFNSAGWRTLEVTTRVEVLKPNGVTHIWLPAALIRNTPYQKTLANKFNAEDGTAKFTQEKAYALGLVSAKYPAGAKPVLTMTSRVSLKNYAVDLSSLRPAPSQRASKDELKLFLQPSRYLPTDGIVKETAVKATAGATTDVDKARAIYEWIVDNTFRDPKTRGCGVGDIRFMLESGNLGGKCADLNALYVGLARASGLPARDVYGVRVAKSQFGYRSLGAGTENITRAQHCRAEVYLEAYGWVPVDPADVRKVVLEERAQPTTVDDPLVQAVRPKLFGAWEMNWLAFNTANDIALPHSQYAKLTFLMYPQAETSAGRLDSLDPDNFRYSMSSKELTA
jgi:transglutaminase-like putative cysteine protease